MVDRSVQISDGQGVTHETIVPRMFADMRAIRVYDGQSDVHRHSVGKKLLAGKGVLVTGAK